MSPLPYRRRWLVGLLAWALCVWAFPPAADSAQRPKFRQLSTEELRLLQDTLRHEERAQASAVAARKALERQIKQEQKRWDGELKRLHQQTVREEKAGRQREKVQAAQHKHAPAPMKVVRGPATPGAPPSVPSEPIVSTTLPPTQQSVELAPVTAAVAPGEPTVEDVPSEELPSPEDLPPGAVNIFADQLSTATDRRLAVARGHVRIIFSDGIMTSDKATLFTDTKDVYAEGRVRLERGKEVYRGEIIHYNLDTKKGRFLEGTAYNPPWYQHGRTIEHLAEGVLRMRPGYVTSCELEPPHFRFQGRQNTVFTDDKISRSRNVVLLVEKLPFIYLPWLSVADRQSPFFIIPGKKKPWEQFALMGYRYEWPAGHKGALRMDWRRAFGWGFGVDHQFEDKDFGKGLMKVYYNEEPNMRATNPKKDTLPKGAALKRYRALFRHDWRPFPDTNVVTDIQEYSDENFRRDFLFREEYVTDARPESFISMVTATEDFLLSAAVKKRMNRFQTITEAFPEATLTVPSQRLGDSNVYTTSSLGFANLQSKTAHSDADSDVVRLDWFQELSYAMNWFRPVLLTPHASVRQAYYTKDIQSGTTDRWIGQRDRISGQFSAGIDGSLKLFRVFPMATNWLGLNLNQLRHVLTPTVAYSYIHQPTIPNSLLNFASAAGHTNQVTLQLENKLQTKRSAAGEKPRSVDLARAVVSLPYTFQGNNNKQGGRVNDWGFDVELYPWPWMRLETDWVIPSHFVPGTRDDRIRQWNTDLVVVGGRRDAQAKDAPPMREAGPLTRKFEPGPQYVSGVSLLPQGEWYLGAGHRYSQNDKTESVLQLDWRLTEKWQIGTFHRLTWKETTSGSKRFGNVRESQYTLTRDLHDWIAEVVYRVDREFGEELFLTLTLKAYPELPIEMGESYHQPKIGSQNSPFSPLRSQHPGS